MSRRSELQLKVLILNTASKLQDISHRLAQSVNEDNFTAVCEAVNDIPNAYKELAVYIQAVYVQVVEEAIQEAGE